MRVKKYSNIPVSIRFRLEFNDSELKRKNSKVQVRVVCFIASDGSSKPFTTPISVYKQHWDSKIELVNNKCPKYPEYNSLIYDWRKYVSFYEFYCFKYNVSPDLGFVKSFLTLEFEETLRDQFNELVGVQKKDTMKKTVTGALEHFFNCSVNHYFDALDNKLLDNYDNYMIGLGFAHKTRQTNMNIIISALNRANKPIFFENHSQRYLAKYVKVE